MFRTHTCGELSLKFINKEVTLSGWVQKVRKLGSITFVDLRDRYGVTQLVFSETFNSLFETQPLGREFVIKVWGKVIERSNKNTKIETGDIEVEVHKYEVLNKAKTPPFTIEENTDGGDELRMKYRYLDLRRSTLQNNLKLRYQVSRAVRHYLDAQNFWDIETPFLIKSTPEGARDFVVPSRMNEGQFYALPQSPQTFKQLLMVSGYDRYYQIVKCFRDEDLRADRQPEFTQIDCEMAFVEQEDVLNTFEGLLKHVLKEVKGEEILNPLMRISFDDAMWHYGNDKPDIRFEMKLQNLKTPMTIDGVAASPNQAYCTILNHVDFKIFNEAETVLAISIPQASSYTRKQIDELTEWVKRPQIGMGGLVYIKYNSDNTIKSSVDKFYNENQLREIVQFCNAKIGDMVLILSGNELKTRKAMSELRLEIANRLNLRNPFDYKPLWVVDFPLFEYAEDEHRWVARHHPFTSPKPEHIDLMIKNNPKISENEKYYQHPYYQIKANAYDLVLNGTEIGGGSIRIYQRELQVKMFEALGMSQHEATEKFGFLLGAFEFGAPPHGGLALGFDRLCALIGGQESIRDFIAFPKNNAGRDVMIEAPSAIDKLQLDELKIEIRD